MTPWELAKTTEHSHQRALFAWANCAALYGYLVAEKPEGYYKATREAYAVKPVPELALLFAIHNQGHGDAIRGAKAKAEGVKKGVPDLMLPVPRGYHGLFIELKLPGFTASDIKPEQTKWHHALSDQGYQVNVCGGWQDAADTIRAYLT